MVGCVGEGAPPEDGSGERTGRSGQPVECSDGRCPIQPEPRSAKGWLMREAGTWIPHLDETRLRILARVLTQVRPRLKRNQARRVRLLSRLIARWSSLSEGSKDRSSDLVFILELAARSELRANRKDNSALLHLIRTLSLNTDIKLRDEVARFVRILADCVPIRERAPFHALAARLSGSPYPIGERN